MTASPANSDDFTPTLLFRGHEAGGAASTKIITDLHVARGQTLTLPLSEALQHDPCLGEIIAWLTRSWEADYEPGMSFSDLLLHAAEIYDWFGQTGKSGPGGIIVLPAAAEPYLDALLAKGFEPSVWIFGDYYVPAFVAASEDGVLAVAMEVLYGEAVDYRKDFPLLVACGDTLRIHNIQCSPLTSEEHDSLSELAESFSAMDSGSLAYPVLAKAHERRRLATSCRHWFVVSSWELPNYRLPD